METKKKILLVEDDLVYSKNIETFLSLEDFDVVCAFNGIDALAIYETNSIDLVLMDGKLPGMSGFELAQIIKMQNPLLPIICISGDDIPSQYRKYFATHHKKPFMFDDLLSTIREIIPSF